MFEDDYEEQESQVAGLVEIGALDRVEGRKALSALKRGASMKQALQAARGKPSPAFGVTAPETERRAPLGFVEDGTNAVGWSLAAVLGDTTIIRAKVSRPTHINRLLLIASATGAVITSLKIGDVEQMLNGAASIEIYGTAALTDPVPDNFDPLKSGTDCIITLQNTTAGAITGTAGAKATVER